MNKLMVKSLRYKKYIAQGGDWGATIVIGQDMITPQIVERYILIV